MLLWLSWELVFTAKYPIIMMMMSTIIVSLQNTSSKKEASTKIAELGVHRMDKGEYAISGEVVLGLDYRDNKLMVKVCRARRLAEARKGSSDPYVKLYLLPDLTSKKKTKIKKRTVNPLFDQTFTVRSLPHGTIYSGTIYSGTCL